MFPFGNAKFSRSSILITCTFTWIIALVMSVIPLLPIGYFGDNFYGRSGVCLALPLTNENPPGWEYSTIVFIGFNFLGFVVIALEYIIMYVAINKSSAKSGGSLQRRPQITIARKMMIIVLTDFLCWLPIIVMGRKAFYLFIAKH